MTQITIDKKELKLQIKAVLDSNMPERYKAGVHNLLGTILDNETRMLSFTDEELEVLTGYIGEALDTKKADRDRKELDSIYRKILE